jgi:hypothetical protein
MASCGWFPLSHAEIQAWVDAHRDALPRTLAELSRYPVPFRKAIAGSVSPDQRTAFWREHLETILATDVTLGPDQRQLVSDAIADLPVIFGSSGNEGMERAKALEDRMRVTITQRQAQLFFGTLGPPEPPEGLPLPGNALPSSVR